MKIAKYLVSTLFFFSISALTFSEDWCIYLGSFRNFTNATRRQELLKKNDIKTNISHYIAPDFTVYYRLMWEEHQPNKESADLQAKMLSNLPIVKKERINDIWYERLDKDKPSSDDSYLNTISLKDNLDNTSEYKLKKAETKTSSGAEREIVVINEPKSFSNYNTYANDAFKMFANPVLYSNNPTNLLNDINCLLTDLTKDQPAQIVLAIDATGSMRDDFSFLKKNLIPELKKHYSEYKNIQWGLLFYKDIEDEYSFNGLPVLLYPFTEDWDLIQQKLDTIYINGGGDTPEAVYEALYAALTFFDWEKQKSTQKHIILIGDAQPHSDREYTADSINSLSTKENIQIHAILIPEYY